MRSFKKALGLVFTIAMMMTCLSFAVSANADVIETGGDDDYCYTLYSDGLLEVVCETDKVDLEKISKASLEKAKSLSMDFSGCDGEYFSVSCNKSYCNISTFKFICSDGQTVNGISILGFPKFTGAAGSVILPGNCDIGYLSVEDSYVSSVDFLKGLNTEGFAFYNCNQLETVTVSGKYESCSVLECDKLTKVDLRGCTRMTACQINKNKELTELYYPDSLLVVAYGSCLNNPKLTDVKIPDSVVQIQDYAFAQTGLKSVTIPDGVMRIGYYSFAGTSLDTVYIPATVNRIDAKAFIGCSIKTVNFGGTQAQFEKIWISNGSSSSVPIYNIFGDAKINFDKTKKSVWVEGGNKWFYFDDKGLMATGWKSINGSRYLFDENDGVMLQNWQQSGKKWYYLGIDGAMKTGWVSVGGVWYYLGSDGAMRLGWQNIGGTWYYFDNNGAMKTGWQSISGTWYYFVPSGAMATGWKQIGSNWYFFKAGGAMAAGEYCNGYWLNSNGTWTYQYKAKWTKDSKGWWFGDSTGWYAKNQSLKIDGKVYNFNANGYCTNP
ncbi:MAG: leucine-rich repeat protein [Saccharofermentans sp.]|nr:leucine-rich repeat protein [Saccharofermentans sp.]